MSKSYRIRTQVGVDKSIKVYLDQEFDYLEILSLKILQSEIYVRPCADYGVIVGRVSVNNGFGIPNAKVSIFIPLLAEDENNPVINDLYPYKTLTDLNEDGYRYNLLPYSKQHGGHVPTGTFPDRLDVLTNDTLIEVYDKYYKYTARTNESGDYMIFGVPLGTQTVHLDVDLSDIGEFSLSPQDLIRMGRATENQIAGANFRSSSNLSELPQIISLNQTIEIEPLWGQEDLCNLGITRTDFDLTEGFNIKIEPTAIFMGSIVSDSERLALRRNCKPRFKQGELCNLVTGPGEILAIRQTIFTDVNGRPGLELFPLDQGGQVIDENGTWLVDVPMNLDYVITNEFGERAISNDPTKGIPTSAKYRFKVKWNQSPSLSENIKRAYFLVPNVKEYGWSNTGVAIVDPVSQQKSYAFSLSWSDYGDTGTTLGNQMIQEAIDCKDRFYPMKFNKVYTVSQMIDQFRQGTLPNRIVSIKNILDDNCESDNNKFPTNDSSFRWDILFLIAYFLMYLGRIILYALLIVIHIVALLLPILSTLLYVLAAVYAILSIYNLVQAFLAYPSFGLIAGFIGKFITYAAYALIYYFLAEYLDGKEIKGVNLPLFLYDQCEFCSCEDGYAVNTSGPSSQTLSAVGGVTINSDGTLLPQFELGGFNAGVTTPWTIVGINKLLTGKPVGQPPNTPYICDSRVPGFFYEENPNPSLPNDSDKYNYFFSTSLTLAERINLFNTKAKYFDDTPSNPGGGVNKIQVKINPSGNTLPTQVHTDNVVCLLLRKEALTSVPTGGLITFQEPSMSTDANLTGATLNQYNNNCTTGTSLNQTNITINYVKTDGTQGTTQYTIPPPNSADTNYSKFACDIEYFQVVTAMTYTAYTSQCATVPATPNSLRRRFLENLVRLKQVIHDTVNDPPALPPGYIYNGITGDYYRNPLLEFEKYKDLVIVFLVRGVDPYSTRVNIKYDLSVLFDYPSFGTGPTVEGSYKLNIPIQGSTTSPFLNINHNLTTNTLQDTTYSNSYLYYDSFNYQPTTFLPFSSKLPKYYSRLDNNTSFTPSCGCPITTTSVSNPSPNGLVADNNNYFTREFVNGGQYNTVYGTNAYQLTFPTYVFRHVPIPNSITGPQFSPVPRNRGYFPNEVVEGGSLMGVTFTGGWVPSDQFNSAQPNANAAYGYISPMYSLTNMSFNGGTSGRQIIMRSDRLPASTLPVDNCGNTFMLQQNSSLYFQNITDNGSVAAPPTNSFGALSSGPSDNEDPSNFTSAIVDTFNNCQTSKPLRCYSYDSANNEYVVDNSGNLEHEVFFDIWALEDKKVRFFKNGCYILVTSPISSLGWDLILLSEWTSRLIVNFAACRNIWSHLFTNNWINGTLYAFAFRNDRFFSPNFLTSPNPPFLIPVSPANPFCPPSGGPCLTQPNQPYSNFCKKSIYFDYPTQTFYYRSSPYFPGDLSDPTPGFVGYNMGNGSLNAKNILFPTTILDLGPRTDYIQELVFSDDYDGYVMSRIPTTTFSEVTDILNTLIFSRLVNSSFIQNFMGAGGANIFGYFDKRSLLTVDGDYAQLISINSELGVNEFDPANYPAVAGGQDPVYFNSGDVDDITIGIFYSSDTKIRDFVTPKRTIINSTLPVTNTCVFNDIPVFSQEVPFYQWELKVNTSGFDSIFGSQGNNWYTTSNTDVTGSRFFSRKYQDMDRLYDNSRYFRGPGSSSEYFKGYIYAFDPITQQYQPDSTLGFGQPQNSPFPRAITVGAPFHFYFGLKKGKSSFDRFAKKWINTELVED